MLLTDKTPKLFLISVFEMTGAGRHRLAGPAGAYLPEVRIIPDGPA